MTEGEGGGYEYVYVPNLHERANRESKTEINSPIRSFPAHVDLCAYDDNGVNYDA